MGEQNKMSVAQILALVSIEDGAMILSLMKGLEAKCYKSLKSMGLEDAEIEETLLDAMTIFIRKVQKNEYTDQGVPVMAYLYKIVKYRAYHYIRIKHPRTVPLDQVAHSISEADKSSLDRWDLVKKALDLLNPTERKLIDLFYFSGYKDKEILASNLMDYTSVDSIKSQRYKCIQKLISLVNELQKQALPFWVVGLSSLSFLQEAPHFGWVFSIISF